MTFGHPYFRNKRYTSALGHDSITWRRHQGITKYDTSSLFRMLSPKTLLRGFSRAIRPLMAATRTTLYALRWRSIEELVCLAALSSAALPNLGRLTSNQLSDPVAGQTPNETALVILGKLTVAMIDEVQDFDRFVLDRQARVDMCYWISVARDVCFGGFIWFGEGGQIDSWKGTIARCQGPGSKTFLRVISSHLREVEHWFVCASCVLVG